MPLSAHSTMQSAQDFAYRAVRLVPAIRHSLATKLRPSNRSSRTNPPGSQWREVDALTFRHYINRQVVARSTQRHGMTTLRNGKFKAIAKLQAASLNSKGRHSPTRYFVLGGSAGAKHTVSVLQPWCAGYPQAAFQ